MMRSLPVLLAALCSFFPIFAQDARPASNTLYNEEGCIVGRLDDHGTLQPFDVPADAADQACTQIPLDGTTPIQQPLYNREGCLIGWSLPDGEVVFGAPN